ncbi:hypothetical protein KSP40_PGU004328 [Platanthera guangdongensis]|uniref:WPP domain-associated protein n=1 Tax=Platanthera guangdongensis TaxID=2320717 RepID=A0ABR2MWN7_9ASPA
MEQIETNLGWSKSSVLDEELSPAAEENMISGFNFNETDTIGNESAHYEKFLLDDFDNYLDEINDRLTVSRLVSDSVIKGMVNAVIEEAAEKVAAKEEEIAILKEKLRASSHLVVDVDSLVPLEPFRVNLDSITTKSFQPQNFLNKRGEWIYPECLGRMKISVENQFQRLTNDIDYMRSKNFPDAANLCSSNKGADRFQFLPQTKMDEKMHLIGEKVEYLRVMLTGFFDKVNDLLSSMQISNMEQHWEHELQEEIRAIAISNFVRDIQEECGTKVFEQRRLINALSTKYEQKVSDISLVREDLDVISKSLLISDQILLLSHTSGEGFEELNNMKRKDQFPLKALGSNHSPSLSHHGENGVSAVEEHPETGNPMLEFADFPHLKHMSKEELGAYYKIEMTKMRRQHDKAMEEKTDELFRLKREFLKEKGSLLSKKDKELENVKKNIRRIMLMLDDMQTEKEMLSVKDDCNELCGVKNRINSMFFENQRLQGLLIRKRKEVECLSAQVKDSASQLMLNTLVNENLSEQIEKLKGDLLDLNVEVGAKEKLETIIWKEVIDKHKLRTEEVEMEINFIHDIYSVLFKASTNDAISMINAIIMETQTDYTSFESMLLQKELALCSEIEGNDKLKQEIASLSALISEKEKKVSEAVCTKLQHEEHFDLVNREIGMLRDQIHDQELIISGNKIQSDLIASRLDETQRLLHVYELEINNLNHTLVVASSSLEESERQRIILQGIIKEKEKKISYSIINGNNQVKQVQAMISSCNNLSELSVDFESKVTGSISGNESRLRILTNECASLKQHINLLLKEGLWYKRMFEITNSNMQKAEAEVDLLGDEVDGLLSVLGKVYVALDHYSPVLQHYSGVMEILKLVRRELQGETTTSP